MGESGKSVLAARHDDGDDDDIYVCVCVLVVCVCVKSSNEDNNFTLSEFFHINSNGCFFTEF